MENNNEKKTVDFKIEDEFDFTRNGFAIIKDLCELRDKLGKLQEEIDSAYGSDPDVKRSPGCSLYSVDGSITETIGEILHAEYEAKRLVFVGGGADADDVADAGNKLSQYAQPWGEDYTDTPNVPPIDPTASRMIKQFGPAAVEGLKL